MKLKGLLFLLATTPLVANAQSATGATIQSVQQQQAYIFQAQQAQMATAQQQYEAQLKAQQRNTMISGVLGACAKMFSGLQQTALNVREAAYKANEDAGFQYDNSLNRDRMHQYGSTGAATFAQGCDRFISSNGQLGPWGRTALAEIRNYPIFSNPDVDVAAICPNYKSFDREQRDTFWVWTFMSMASKESSCNEGTVARGVNAQAVGLFQLHGNQCPGNMRDGHQNTGCAVTMLADELNKRRRLVSRCSSNCNSEDLGRAEATYWAVLRADGAPDDPKRMPASSTHPDRRKEIQAGYESRQLMAKAPGCRD